MFCSIIFLLVKFFTSAKLGGMDAFYSRAGDDETGLTEPADGFFMEGYQRLTKPMVWLASLPSQQFRDGCLTTPTNCRNRFLAKARIPNVRDD
jgi:hypothetical protein